MIEIKEQFGEKICGKKTLILENKQIWWNKKKENFADAFLGENDNYENGDDNLN